MANSTVPEASRATEVARLELTRLPADLPLERLFCQVCMISANALQVERVGVWLFIDNRQVLRCANLYERSKGEHSSGSVLRVADFPTYFSSLTIRKAVPAEVACTESWTSELADTYLRPLNITSMLDAGIFVDNQLVGVVCHENTGPPREWTTEARDFAGSVADFLALRIQSAEVRDLRSAFLTQRERLAAQDTIAALERLAAGVAHDFRNLLTVFLANGDLIRLRTDIPDEVRELGKIIVDAAERGIALAGELLDFAKPNKKPPAVIDLAEATRQFMPMLQVAVSRKYELHFTCPVPLGPVLIDKSQYTRLLLNLVVNARDAMPDGGRIEIRLKPVKLTNNPSYTGNYVLLEVSDQGQGMDEATQKRIFEPFFSTKSRGTGLGLAIVRQIVDQVGGLIRIDSAHGQGTTFRLFFPRIGGGLGTSSIFPLPPESCDSEAG
jgi:signal transduction histidine kinase